MIVNGFGGGSGGFEGTSTLVKTITGSYSTTRSGGEITTENSGEVVCSATAYKQVWHSTSSVAIGDWSTFNNICNSKAMKIVFRITSLTFTGKVGLFTNKYGSTDTQTLNLQVGIGLLFTYRYNNSVDWNVSASPTYGTGNIGSSSAYCTMGTGTTTGRVPSVPSSGSTVTNCNYPTLTWTSLPDPSNLYFIQELTTINGTKYWTPYAPTSLSKKVPIWASGSIYMYLDCYACGASGGNGSMYWQFYYSGDSTVWPILTMNYAIDAYAIN